MNSTVQPAVAESESRRTGLEALARSVPAPLRADLIIRRQLFKFAEYYVIKDPLALTYFRLEPEEAYLASLLDGKRTLEQVANLFAVQFPNADGSIEQIGGFVNQLGVGGLLNVNARQFVERARRGGSLTMNLFALWGKIVSGFLFLKVPLFDPSPWLGKLSHALRFAWTPWFVGLCLAFYLWTIGFLVVHREAFSVDILNFLSPRNFLLLWLTIILIKAIHEFSHATTCRHFGGEVHEMGVCLMCFTPCGYVDASDAWMMRHKRHKIYTTIAGIFTELVIAGIAAHFWILLPDGFARGLAFNVMLVASVNTLVFNANPLMRFDGYYVLCDALEIPNLRTKAIAYCSYHVQRVLMGYRNIRQEMSWGSEASGRLFVIYALFAYLYMFFIIYGLTKIFARVLAPYGLYDFGLMLGVFVEGSFALFPVIKVFMDAFQPGAHIVKTSSTGRRLAATASVVAVVVAAGFVVPTHYRVVQQGLVVAVDSEFIAPTVPGVVKTVVVRTGQWVEPGDLVATLDNPSLAAELEARRVELAQFRLQLAQIGQGGNLQLLERQAGAAKMLAVAEAAYDRAADDVSRLELRAKVAGTVVTPSVQNFVGMYLVPQQSLIRIANMKKVKLVIPLTEDQAQLVERGNPVSGRWVANGNKFETVLTTVPTQAAGSHDLLTGMFSMFGGPAPLDVAQRSGHIGTGGFALFIAEAQLPDVVAGKIEGMRAEVAITGRPATPAKKIWRWLVSLWVE
ncbi:MAG: efflux RND transporter periplasmic adaptor subunit [Verrucomicrobia bacterium]|nr:efflux RND transporter periplasmic adaptor subunit [Verrucomicrobiota bacterium]